MKQSFNERLCKANKLLNKIRLRFNSHLKKAISNPYKEQMKWEFRYLRIEKYIDNLHEEAFK